MKKNEVITNSAMVEKIEMAKATVEGTAYKALEGVLSLASDNAVTLVDKEMSTTGKEYSIKEYQLINPIGKRTSLTTMNENIIRATEKIGLALYAGRVAEFAVCRELSKINNESALSELGMKSIGEYANALFDLSRVTATQYSRIGELFIDDEYKLKYRWIPRSFQKSHLLELLTVVGEGGEEEVSKLEALFLEGTLHDGMSTSAIRKALKSISDKNIIDTDIVSESTIAPTDETEGAQAIGGKGKSKKGATPSMDYSKQISIGKVLSLLTEANNIMVEMASHGDNVDAEIFGAISTLVDKIGLLVTE